MRVMIVGASNDRRKFGNKAVRAYLRQGYAVMPVNPHETEVEGLACVATVGDALGPVDRTLFYVPPEIGLMVIDQLARRFWASVAESRCRIR